MLAVDLTDGSMTTHEEWAELEKALKRIANNADGVSAFPIERRMPRSALNLLKDDQHLLDGNTFVFYQWSEKCDKNLSCCCAVRVNDIREIRGFFKEFFEFGSSHDDVTPNVVCTQNVCTSWFDDEVLSIMHSISKVLTPKLCTVAS